MARDLTTLSDAQLHEENTRLGAELHQIRERRAAADAALLAEREAVRAQRAAITAEFARRAAEEAAAHV